MPPSSTPSNIRVFVTFKDPTVFAGEDVDCTITFKNTASTSEDDDHRDRRRKATSPGTDRQRKVSTTTASANANALPKSPLTHSSAFASHAAQQRARGHRPALSLNVSSSGVERARPPMSVSGGQGQGQGHGQRGHGRSLSIISMGSAVEEGPSRKGSVSSVAGQGPGMGQGMRPKGHARAASLQVVPRRGVGSPSLGANGGRSATQGSPAVGARSPLVRAESQQDVYVPSSTVSSRRNSRGSASSPAPPVLGRRKPSGTPSMTSFKFPPTPQIEEPPEDDAPLDSGISPRTTPEERSHSPRRPNGMMSGLEVLPPVTRILSASSMNGTPRSSMDFYSMNSNHSSETLASEYQAPANGRLLPKPALNGRPLSVIQETETLMMGYAQLMGSFTVDGSLINQAPFEEVKRKGVVGGQGGGGVVGVERTKRESGLFGALGWGNIGESLGGLLGGGELSSIKEMKGIASSKTVPLISTAQSILFVDLKLAPGESRSFRYSYTLPRGLPPTHRGRAIKVSYHLTIGTQRPGSGKNQQVKQVDVPFRVFGGVNNRGEILGHDLMSPYVLLREQARMASLDVHSPSELSAILQKPSIKKQQPQDSLDDFLSYVNNLLDHPRQNSSYGLLSPTDHLPRRASSYIEDPSSMKDRIDLAILRSNVTPTSSTAPNRFEIARSGRRVAVITLARPSYRLGESIPLAISFTDAPIPVYRVLISLETAEKVDPAIALRSQSSIHRVTRKIHASMCENTLFSRRVAVSLAIPPNATPEFVTSGVSLEWKVRIEFVTPRIGALIAQAQGDEEGEEEVDERLRELRLLEESSRDDRGVVESAVERLQVESFEVMVPVRVYGASALADVVAGGTGGGEEDEGLPV